MDSQNRGRLSMAIHPISYFTGADAVTPFEDELCYDDETFDIYIWKLDDKGEWYRVSKTATIQQYITSLENSGIFTSAAAFVNNRKIYRFYFDQTNGVVRLDPDLRFDSLYRYYAIRKTEVTGEGAYIYVTGVSGTDIDGNDVYASLVNMDLEESESGDGTSVSVPQVGGLVEEITNGSTYVVEFYDINRQLVNIVSYQAIAVRTAELDLAPDTAVTDMYIQTNQSYDSEGDSVYLYRGQDVSNLELEVRLKYADGRTRSVTHEQYVGGRLSIVGRDELNTDSITEDGSEPQTFDVVYTMIRSNASLPAYTTETDTGALVSPSSLTITKTIKVYIIEDIYNDLVSIVPSGYVDTSVIGNPKIVLRYFGHYSNGTVHDITNIVTYVDNKYLVNNSFGVVQNLKISVPYGNAGLVKTKEFSINVPEYNSATSNPVAISGANARYITFDNTATAGGIYAGKFTGFQLFNTTTQTWEQVSYAAMLSLDEVKYGSHIPTHIRVRDVIDPTYTFTDIVDASSGAYFSTIGSGHEISKDRALLVEFFELVTDEAGNAVSVFTTGAMIHYAKAS